MNVTVAVVGFAPTTHELVLAALLLSYTANHIYLIIYIVIVLGIRIQLPKPVPSLIYSLIDSVTNMPIHLIHPWSAKAFLRDLLHAVQCGSRIVSLFAPILVLRRFFLVPTMSKNVFYCCGSGNRNQPVAYGATVRPSHCYRDVYNLILLLSQIAVVFVYYCRLVELQV